MARTVVQFLSGIILDSMVEWGCNRTLIRKLAIVVGKYLLYVTRYWIKLKKQIVVSKL